MFNKTNRSSKKHLEALQCFEKSINHLGWVGFIFGPNISFYHH